jgi:hypothetical protein
MPHQIQIAPQRGRRESKEERYSHQYGTRINSILIAGMLTILRDSSADIVADPAPSRFGIQSGAVVIELPLSSLLPGGETM